MIFWIGSLQIWRKLHSDYRLGLSWKDLVVLYPKCVNGDEMSFCFDTVAEKEPRDVKQDELTIGKLCSNSAAGKDNRRLCMLQLLQTCTKARHSLSSHHRFYISLQAAWVLTNWQNIRKASLSRQTNLHISDTDAGQTDKRYKWIHKHMYTHAFIGVHKHVGDHESTHAHYCGAGANFFFLNNILTCFTWLSCGRFLLFWTWKAIKIK